MGIEDPCSLVTMSSNERISTGQTTLYSRWNGLDLEEMSQTSFGSAREGIQETDVAAQTVLSALLKLEVVTQSAQLCYFKGIPFW